MIHYHLSASTIPASAMETLLGRRVILVECIERDETVVGVGVLTGIENYVVSIDI